jgi:hypothetical protein
VPLSQVRCAMNVWATSSYEERDGGFIDSAQKESLGSIFIGGRL